MLLIIISKILGVLLPIVGFALLLPVFAFFFVLLFGKQLEDDIPTAEEIEDAEDE